MDYDKYCTFIEEKLKEGDMSFYYLIDKYCMYIYKNTEEYKKDEDAKLDIVESEKIIESFLGDFSQELLDSYLNITRDTSFHFKDVSTLILEVEPYIKELKKQKNDLEDEVEYLEKEQNQNPWWIKDEIKCIDKIINVCNERLLYGDNVVGYDGNVHITIFNNISDVFYIIHEYTHKLFMPTQSDNDIDILSHNENMLSETLPITMELIVYDYLKQGIYLKDANNYLLNRFSMIRDYALQFHYMMLLIQNYSKFNTLNDEVVNIAILNEDEVIRNDLLTKKKELNNVCFSFDKDILYIIGLLVGCQLKSKIQDDPYKLIEFGKNMYEASLEDVLAKFGVPLFDSSANDNFSLNLEICNTFLDEYHNLYDSKDFNRK